VGTGAASLRALALALFLSNPVKAPAWHLIELVFALLALFALFGLTWHWPGGREADEK